MQSPQMLSDQLPHLQPWSELQHTHFRAISIEGITIINQNNYQNSQSKIRY